MRERRNSKSGQTMVEYIIIVVIIAIAAIAVFGVFGDTIRQKLSGAVSEMDDGDLASDAQAAATDEASADWLKSLEDDGHN
ncbi:MAG: pilus assembly protein [Verrucomicrobia bacterium]|jgi:Flp pilus assembly pilin Flp|nr:pilus assembly protein [Verrucomicrobiota bacterium]